MKSQDAKKQKVFVGLSGGVDSSTSAALLKEAGFDVVGVFIKVWQPSFVKTSEGEPSFVECSWKTDRMDAMRVCAHLGIPFKTLNLEKEYKKEVVDYMISEYKTGRTPNPDVMCNRYIKFGAFFKWAMAQGADFVATGHYTQLRRKVGAPTEASENLKPKTRNVGQGSKKPINSPKKVTSYRLQVSRDANKDQSYFLWTLTQKELSKTLFPVGGMEKLEVRKLAEKFGLLTATKKDSQGLCFIGKVNMKDFLKSFIKAKKGDVLNIKGEKVGWHDGAVFLTLGQRHGFTITKKGNEDKPLYVVAKNIKKNTIIVSEKGPKGELAKMSDIAEIKNTNWINEAPKIGRQFLARLRYRQPLQKCKFIKISGKTAKIKFSKPQNAITSGQSLVVYDSKGEECIGGGVIC